MLETERVRIDTLNPHPRNARRGDIAAIKESLEAHGQFRHVVANRRDRTILAGNHTAAAARELGWTEIDVSWVDVDDDEAVRILLVDNRLNDLSAYDESALVDLLTELANADAGLAHTGFDETDLEDLIAALNVTPVDDEPRAAASDDALPVPEEPITQPGDIWVLGSHRLVCGDCRNPYVLARLLGDEHADMVWTDPPYGVDYGAKNRFLQTIGRSDRLEEDIAGDGSDPEALKALLCAAFDATIAVTRPGAVWFVAAPAGPPLGVFAAELLRLNVWRQQIVWVKNRAVFGRSDYHYQHEALFYGWTPGAAHQPPPNQSTSSVWQFDAPQASKLHPTMKPVALVVAAIANHTALTDLVLDPFAGSGTTLVACEQEGRRARCVELQPGYCDVIVERWQTMTGQTAVREEKDLIPEAG